MFRGSKVVSVFMSLVLVITLCPTPAFAAGENALNAGGNTLVTIDNNALMTIGDTFSAVQNTLLAQDNNTASGT